MDVGSVQGKPTALTPQQREDAKLRKVAQEFEAIMYRQMLAEMRKSMPESSMTPKNFATETHQSMMDGYMADLAAKQGGSLAEVLYRQLSGYNATKDSNTDVDTSKDEEHHS